MDLGSPRTNLQIRVAVSDDAEGICEAHYYAVHVTAARDYAADVLHAWQPPDRESSVTRTRQFLAQTGFYTLVALVENRIAGFASLDLEAGELRAVYVHPAAGRHGIGSSLLAAIEVEARRRKMRAIHMNSSITARPFYEKHGYQVERLGTHTLSSGVPMACVHMSKAL